MFRTQYSTPVRFHAEPGSVWHTTYQAKVDDRGHIDLVVSGRENIYEEIQSHKDSTDIHVILQRYNNGELDALSKVQGVYQDLTQMPKTYAELLNALIAGENYFNSLPVETRAKFNHSFYEFMAGMDHADFFERLGITPDVPAAPAASESVSGGVSDALPDKV